MADPKTILTNAGRAKILNALTLGQALAITQMALGSTAIAPDAAMVALPDEVWRGNLESLEVDPSDDSLMVARVNVPVEAGTWYVRSAGLFDSDGELIAIASLAALEKRAGFVAMTVTLAIAVGTAEMAGITLVPAGPYVSTAEKGQAGGVATLDNAGKLSAAQLPDSVQRFRGKFVSLAALTAAIPAASEGDYAIINPGAGVDAQEAIWDAEEGWVVSASAAPATTDEVTEGGTNLYFTAQRVRDVVLTGLSLATNAIITAADTVIAAVGKLQAQITGIDTRVTALEEGGSGIAEAPSDGTPYMRQDAGWVSPATAGVPTVETTEIASVTIGAGGDYPDWDTAMQTLSRQLGRTLVITLLSDVASAATLKALALPGFNYVHMDFNGCNTNLRYIIGTGVGVSLAGAGTIDPGCEIMGVVNPAAGMPGAALSLTPSSGAGTGYFSIRRCDNFQGTVNTDFEIRECGGFIVSTDYHADIFKAGVAGSNLTTTSTTNVYGACCFNLILTTAVDQTPLSVLGDWRGQLSVFSSVGALNLTKLYHVQAGTVKEELRTLGAGVTFTDVANIPINALDQTGYVLCAP